MMMDLARDALLNFTALPENHPPVVTKLSECMCNILVLRSCHENRQATAPCNVAWGEACCASYSSINSIKTHKNGYTCVTETIFPTTYMLLNTQYVVFLNISETNT